MPTVNRPAPVSQATGTRVSDSWLSSPRVLRRTSLVAAPTLRTEPEKSTATETPMRPQRSPSSSLAGNTSMAAARESTAKNKTNWASSFRQE